MQEARELANDPSTDYTAAPLEVSSSIRSHAEYGISSDDSYFCISCLI